MNNYYKYKKFALILAIISMLLSIFRYYIPVKAATSTDGAFYGLYNISWSNYNESFPIFDKKDVEKQFFSQAILPQTGMDTFTLDYSKFDLLELGGTSDVISINTGLSKTTYPDFSFKYYFTSQCVHAYGNVYTMVYYLLFVDSRYNYAMFFNTDRNNYEIVTNNLNYENILLYEFDVYNGYTYGGSITARNFSTGANVDGSLGAIRFGDYGKNFYATNFPISLVDSMDDTSLKDYILNGNGAGIVNGESTPIDPVDEFSLKDYDMTLTPSGSSYQLNANYHFNDNEKLSIMPESFEWVTNMTIYVKYSFGQNIWRTGSFSNLNDSVIGLKGHENSFQIGMLDVNFGVLDKTYNAGDLFVDHAAGLVQMVRYVGQTLGYTASDTDTPEVHATYYVTSILYRNGKATSCIMQYSFNEDLEGTALKPTVNYSGEGDDKTVSSIVTDDNGNTQNVIDLGNGTSSSNPLQPTIPERNDPDLSYKDLIFNLKDVVEGANKDILSFHKTFMGIIPEKFWGLIYYFVAVSVILLTVTIIAKALKGVIS